MRATESAFDGFGPDALKFLKALGFHQDREWFQENRAIYDAQLREPLVALVETMSDRLKEGPLPVHGSGKASVFRINRDVRFSKDKNPYKTNAAAVLTRTGTKKDRGGLYIHVAPDGGSFLASGLWFPPSPYLKAMRDTLVARPADWKAVIASLDEAGLAIEGLEDALKRPPRGFADIEDDWLMSWVKRKSFVAQRPIAEERLFEPGLVDDIAAFAQAVAPLMNFVWRATDPVTEADGNA